MSEGKSNLQIFTFFLRTADVNGSRNIRAGWASGCLSNCGKPFNLSLYDDVPVEALAPAELQF